MSLLIKKQKPLVRVAFRLEQELIEQVALLSKKEGVTPSDVHRHIVQYFFSQDCQQIGDNSANNKAHSE